MILKQLELDTKLKKATLTGDFAAKNLPYKVTLGNDSFKTSDSWQLKVAPLQLRWRIGCSSRREWY